jgi:hypothetical protein
MNVESALGTAFNNLEKGKAAKQAGQYEIARNFIMVRCCFFATSVWLTVVCTGWNWWLLGGLALASRRATARRLTEYVSYVYVLHFMPFCTPSLSMLLWF